MTSLFDNPFDSDLFVPTLIRVGALLVVGFVVVGLVERKRWSVLRTTPLFQKVLSWAIMAPTFLAAIFVGGPVGLLVVGFLVVQSIAEYSRLVGLRRRYAWVLMAAGLGTLIGTGVLARYFLFGPLIFLPLIVGVPIFSGDVEDSHRQVSGSLFGFIYIPFFLSYLVFIKVVDAEGLEVLLICGLTIALSDVVAFTIGSTLRGPKLAPSLSPGKTWAGAAGNIAGAYLAWLLMAFAIPSVWTGVTLVVAPLVIGLASLYGDLVQSFVKRDFGVKDAGTLLPGFGGLLDRIDSLLLALPMGFYAIEISQYFTAGV